MKNAILALLVTVFGSSAFATSLMQATLEDRIVELSCQRSNDNEIKDLCKQIGLRNERRIQAIDIENRLYPIYRAEIANDKTIINYGGLNDVRITCDADSGSFFRCNVSASAGNDGGTWNIWIKVLVEAKANGELVRTILEKTEQGID